MEGRLLVERMSCPSEFWYRVVCSDFLYYRTLDIDEESGKLHTHKLNISSQPGIKPGRLLSESETPELLESRHTPEDEAGPLRFDSFGYSSAPDTRRMQEL